MIHLVFYEIYCIVLLVFGILCENNIVTFDVLVHYYYYY